MKFAFLILGAFDEARDRAQIAGGAARGNSRRTEKFNKSFFGTGHGQSNFNLMFT